MNITNTYLNATLIIWEKRKFQLVHKISSLTILSNQGWFNEDMEKLVHEWRKQGLPN